MKLSKKSEYACLALIELSENYNKSLVRIGDISERRKIPKKYLEQILLLLKGARYVRSIRGAKGGYKLSKPPCDITVAEVLRLTGGALSPVDSVSVYFYESSPVENNRKLMDFFTDIRDYIIKKSEETTFADLIEG